MPVRYTTSKPGTAVWQMPLLPVEGKRKCERLSSNALLTLLLGREVEVKHTAEGVPYVEGLDKHLSVSHNSSRLVVALSGERVGVDIESITPLLERVKHKFLSAEELHRLPTGSLRELAVCWSVKEAVYKLAGDKAGALGEHISIDTAGACGRLIRASIGDVVYRAEVLEMQDDYEIVVAWEC